MITTLKSHKSNRLKLIALLATTSCIVINSPTAFAKRCADYSAAELLAKAETYSSAIERYASMYSVDPHIVRSVITVESCYKPRAVSHAGARGLMQLMPATAKRFGVTNSFNTTQNIRGGTKYLRFLQKRFPGNLSHALAGYNAGEGNVDKYKGIPPFKETKRYVYDVIRVYAKLSPHKITPDDYAVLAKYSGGKYKKNLRKQPKEWIDPYEYSLRASRKKRQSSQQARQQHIAQQARQRQQNQTTHQQLQQASRQLLANNTVNPIERVTFRSNEQGFYRETTQVQPNEQELARQRQHEYELRLKREQLARAQHIENVLVAEREEFLRRQEIERNRQVEIARRETLRLERLERVRQQRLRIAQANIARGNGGNAGVNHVERAQKALANSIRRQRTQNLDHVGLLLNKPGRQGFRR